MNEPLGLRERKLIVLAMHALILLGIAANAIFFNQLRQTREALEGVKASYAPADYQYAVTLKKEL